MKREEHVSRLYPGCGTPTVSVYLAQLMQLSDIEVVARPDKPLPQGWTIVVRVSASLLALSRRDGGLRYRFGVLEGEATSFGTIYVHGEGELNLILLDLSAPEVHALVAESTQNGSMKLLLVDDTRQMRLMVPQSDTDFQLLRDAAKPKRMLDAGAFAARLGDAMRFATSEEVLAQLGLTLGTLSSIQVSCLVTPQRAAEVERFMLGGVTH